MFVTLAIEDFAEVECLLPSAELDFYNPAGAVEVGEWAHVGLCFFQVGQHEMPAVAEKSSRTGSFNGILCFFATFGTLYCGDFWSRMHGEEATFFALLTNEDIEIEEISTEAFKGFFLGASIV